MSEPAIDVDALSTQGGSFDPGTLNWADSDGWSWTRAVDSVPAHSWRTLGVLEFPETGALENIVVAGATSPAREDVLLWCPVVRAEWLTVPAFAEATKGVLFTGPTPVWAKNATDVDVTADVRVRFRGERVELPTSPAVTEAYYASRVWRRTTYFGIEILKCPLDLWIMQEILHEVQPDLVIETGTHRGGSALWFAHTLAALGAGLVATIDVEDREELPEHDRIDYLHGSSVDPEVLEDVETLAEDADAVLVVLDSDHSYDHVLAELRAYAPLVTPGSFLVVEDTNTPGPAEAVAAFLASPEGREFSADLSREKFGTTFNKGGWLKRGRGL